MIRRDTVTLPRWVSQKYGGQGLDPGIGGFRATGIYYREVSEVSFRTNGQPVNVHSLPRMRGGLRRILRVSMRGRGDVRHRSDREARTRQWAKQPAGGVRGGEFTGFGFILPS